MDAENYNQKHMAVGNKFDVPAAFGLDIVQVI